MSENLLCGSKARTHHGKLPLDRAPDETPNRETYVRRPSKCVDARDRNALANKMGESKRQSPNIGTKITGLVP